MSKNIILITGASSDIGQEVIKKFINDKNILITTYNKNKVKIKKNSKGTIIKFKLDLLNEKKVLEFIKNLSKKKLIPNKLIHIASDPLKMSSFTDLKWSDYEKNLNIQIKSFFLISDLIGLIRFLNFFI